MIHDWSDEETNNSLLADEYNFYKVEKWTGDGAEVCRLLYAGIISNGRTRYSRTPFNSGRRSD
jgi:hypothetical protein